MKKVVYSIMAALIVACLAVPIAAEASDSIPGQIDVRIGSQGNVSQLFWYGGTSITVKAGSHSIGGFNFLIGWNSHGLRFRGVQPGLLCNQQTGEFGYFDLEYTQVELPPIEDVCGDGLLTGFAEIRSKEFIKSSDTTLGLRVTGKWQDNLCILHFHAPEAKDLHKSTQHIHFVWFDCGDNLIRSHAGDTLHLAGSAFIEADSGKTVEIGKKAGFPSLGGLSDSCLVEFARSQTAALMTETCYFNGQLRLLYPWPIELEFHGDINLNGISNEVADGELFARYLVYGDSVFIVNVEGSIQASDMNNDDIPLTLEDFVFLQMIIRGNELVEAAPHSKQTALFSHDSSTSEVSLTTGHSLGVALLLFVGESAPTLLDDNLEMVYGHDRSVTRVLLWPKMGHWIVDGPLLRSLDELVHVDALTSLGGAIRTEIK